MNGPVQAEAGEAGPRAVPKGRPPQLFPLFAAADTLPGIGPKAAASLSSLDVARPRDLLLTLPFAVAALIALQPGRRRSVGWLAGGGALLGLGLLAVALGIAATVAWWLWLGPDAAADLLVDEEFVREIEGQVNAINQRILGRYQNGLGKTWDDPNHMKFFNDGKVKVELALARGKQAHDKRHDIARRTAQREVERELGRRVKGM